MTNRIPTGQSSRRGALLASALLLLASLASAQAPQTPPTNPDDDLKLNGMPLRELESLLDARDRDFLHPGQPLLVIGNEEGDNGFRHNTPLLEGAGRERDALDAAEARERRLAMYNDGARYSAPQPLSSSVGVEFDSNDSRDPSGASEAAESSTADAEEQGPSTSFLMLIVGLVVSLATFAWRKRYLFAFWD